jgi:hypothetical protein
MIGGSAWESNPPGTRKVPPNGFEVREAHRDLSAPPKRSITYYLFTSKRDSALRQHSSRPAAPDSSFFFFITGSPYWHRNGTTKTGTGISRLFDILDFPADAEGSCNIFTNRGIAGGRPRVIDNGFNLVHIGISICKAIFGNVCLGYLSHD